MKLTNYFFLVTANCFKVVPLRKAKKTIDSTQINKETTEPILVLTGFGVEFENIALPKL